MNERLMDDILITFGMMLADRNVRKESDQFVEETIIAPATCNEYAIVWNTGDTLDIYCYPRDETLKQKKLATFYMDHRFMRYDRNMAKMIYGVIIGYEEAMKIKQ